MRRPNDVLVHRRGHEGLLLEAHVLVEPRAVGQAFLREEDLHQADRQVRVDRAHVLDPIGVQGHAHEHVLVAADGVHALEDVDAAPAEVDLAFGGPAAGVAVGLEVDPPAVQRGVRQARAGVLLPTGAVLHEEVHVLRRAGLVFPPSQEGAVGVADELRVGRLLDDVVLLLPVQVGRHAERPAGAQVQAEVLAEVLIRLDVPLAGPLGQRLGPEALVRGDAVHRLALQEPRHPFLAGQFFHE